jgi:hypothetical protein
MFPTMFKSDTHYTHSDNEFTTGQRHFIISDAITEYPLIVLASACFHNRIARVGMDVLSWDLRVSLHCIAMAFTISEGCFVLQRLWNITSIRE